MAEIFCLKRKEIMLKSLRFIYIATITYYFMESTSRLKVKRKIVNNTEGWFLNVMYYANPCNIFLQV